MIEKIRTWRAYRIERRQRIERARLQALLFVAGGCFTMPRRRPL